MRKFTELAIEKEQVFLISAYSDQIDQLLVQSKLVFVFAWYLCKASDF